MLDKVSQGITGLGVLAPDGSTRVTESDGLLGPTQAPDGSTRVTVSDGILGGVYAPDGSLRVSLAASLGEAGGYAADGSLFVYVVTGVLGADGGALLLSSEASGLGIDFTYNTDTDKVVAVKDSGTTYYNVDSFLTNDGTSPKLVLGPLGTYVWSAHNLFLNSATPATQNVTLLVGATYTVTVTGSGSMAGSGGASGTASEGTPATFVATTTTGTFTLTGSLTTIQLNRGSVPTAYLATTSAARYGTAIEYDSAGNPIGALVEPAATNRLLNNATLSTQNVTVTAVAHTLSFFGTGTVTLSGVSTAGPLVGTGANDRVSLTFTPTAGTLTLTVSGSVTTAQLETGSAATSPIPTFGTTVTRASDDVYINTSTFPVGAAAGTLLAKLVWSVVDTQAGTAVSSGFGPGFFNNANTEYLGFGKSDTSSRNGQLNAMAKDSAAAAETIGIFGTDGIAPTDAPGKVGLTWDAAGTVFAVPTATSLGSFTSTIPTDFTKLRLLHNTYPVQYASLVYLPRKMTQAEIEAWADAA